MKPLYTITLALVILLSQLSSIEHAYHDHDTGEACEYCLSAQALDAAVLTPELKTPVHSLSFQLKQLKLSNFTESCFTYYAARAPPSYT